MKLLVKGNSLMFRLTRSEVRVLYEMGRIEETAHFSTNPDSEVAYALEYTKASESAVLHYRPQEVLIQLPAARLGDWIRSDETLLYAGIDLSTRGMIDIFIAKDYELLDKDQQPISERRAG